MAIYPVRETANTTCILNGASVHAEAARALIARVSSELGTQARVIVTRTRDELVPSARRAVSEKNSRVAAGGGDGTVNAVAGAVAGTDTALGVLPIGTLNHFAKDAGIPLELEDAVRNFFTGRVVKLDVGEVNGRVFVNNSGIGVIPISCASAKRSSATVTRSGWRSPSPSARCCGAIRGCASNCT